LNLLHANKERVDRDFVCVSAVCAVEAHRSKVV